MSDTDKRCFWRWKLDHCGNPVMLLHPNHPAIWQLHGRWPRLPVTLFLCDQADVQTHTEANLPNLYLLSPLFLSLSHTHSAYTHTWHFIFVSIFWVLQFPAGLWTLASLRGEALRCASCETLWQSYTMLTSLYLPTNSTSWKIKTYVPGTFFSPLSLVG